MKKDVSVEIKGRHIVILEDILDSGLTLRAVANHLVRHGTGLLKNLCVAG